MSPEPRSAQVWLEIDNSAEGLRAGTFLKGEIELRRATGRQALPRGAIRDEGRNGEGAKGESSTGSVLAIREGQIVLVPVTVGARWHGGAMVEVAGLATVERVVALPLTGLAAGDRVGIAEN